MDKVSEVFSGILNEKTWHNVKDTVLAFSGVIFGVLVVILLITLGWFIVWKMFLVRFPLIRELVYGSSDESKINTSRGSSSNGNLPLRRSSRLQEKKEHSD